MKLEKIVLPAGPLKRVWVNKNHLPQFGGTSPTAPVWFVEVQPMPEETDGKAVRHSGHRVEFVHYAYCVYDPSEGDGPHAWVQTWGEVRVYQAVEEAAS